jgi:hypothetical protein
MDAVRFFTRGYAGGELPDEVAEEVAKAYSTHLAAI